MGTTSPITQVADRLEVLTCTILMYLFRSQFPTSMHQKLPVMRPLPRVVPRLVLIYHFLFLLYTARVDRLPTTPVQTLFSPATSSSAPSFLRVCIFLPPLLRSFLPSDYDCPYLFLLHLKRLSLWETPVPTKWATSLYIYFELPHSHSHHNSNLISRSTLQVRNMLSPSSLSDCGFR